MTGPAAFCQGGRYTNATSTTTNLEYPHELKEQAKAILESRTPPPPPVRLLHGVLRVGRTRVSLDTVIYAFNKGCSPRVILRKYPSLELADIYSTIAYYLWNKEMIDAYLEAREKHAEEVRRKSSQEVALRMPEIEDPAEMIAGFDGQREVEIWAMNQADCWKPAPLPPADAHWPWPGVVAKRHNEGFAAAYCDGHARRIKESRCGEWTLFASG